MKVKLLITLMSLLAATQVWAQSAGRLRGTVMDQKGVLLPGVSILLTDSTGRTITSSSTNANGIFVLEGLRYAEKYLLKASMIGFETYQEATKPLQPGDTNSILIRLQEQSAALDEVVVIGYGEQRRENLTTAIGSLPNVAKNVDRPTTNVSDLLQGNVAGITVMSAGGDPSSAPSVMIRGMGTVNGEQPLYVVDGMPYYGGPINPNDIEKVDIMKDAAAAAIYGAQASAGVIAITTKSGKAGKPRFNIDFYQGWHKASNLPSALNAEQYAQTYVQAAEHAGNTPADGHNPELNPWGQVTRTNWMDEIFRTGNITNANIQVSGGGEKSVYSSSFGYHNKEGLLLNTNYRRFTYRLKSEFNVSDRFTLGQNFYVNHAASQGTNTSSSYSGSIINAIYMNPAAPVYDENGLFHGTVPFDLSRFSGAYGDTYNPVALLLRPTVNNPTVNINGNAYARFTLMDGLMFKSNFAIDLNKYSYKRFDPKIPEIGRSNGENYLTHEEANTSRWIWDQQLNFKKRFGDHGLDVLAVYSAQKTRFDRYAITGRGFEREDDWYQYIGNASIIPNLPTSEVYEDALTSAIGRVSYDYADRYFLSASIRKDRTSRIAAANRSDVFRSLSGAWKISSEPFFDSSFINSLKLRASWGQIGNIQSIDNYAFDIPLSTGTLTPIGSGDQLLRHFAVNQRSNPNLKWETAESIDIGMDILMLDKLSLTADYYRKKTIGMLLRESPDPHLGLNQGAFVNVGDVMNKGFEFVANYNERLGELRFSLNANIAFNRNELLSLTDYRNDFVNHTDHVRSVLLPYRSTPGQPLYSYFLIPTEGIFSSTEEIQAYAQNGQLVQPNARPGDLRFVDTNGDGRINDDDKVYMGSAVPDFTYGFSFQVDYKNFDLNVLTYGISGSKIFNGYKYTAYNAGLQGYNLDSRVLNAWRPDNLNADIPVVSTRDPNNNFGTASDWYLESGDYFRIKNITLGYNLPTTGLFAKMSSGIRARIYASAENPFTFTSYSGIDPEVGNIGLDVGNYPLPKTYTLGINVSF